jgi:hypothetical protein
MPQNTAQSFEADILQALSRSGIDPEALSVEEAEIARRYFSQKERDSMDTDQFCGPHKSFPITTQADVFNAAKLIGHADNPDAVKACIKRKAKARGWDIPDSWKSDSDSSDGDGDRTTSPDERDASPMSPPSAAAPATSPHAPHTGKHSHGHPHMDGYDHEHLHEHNNDNHHDHHHEHHLRVTSSASPDETARTTMPDHIHLYAPITRIDNDKWEVEGVATSEMLDTYGTIFSYEASKKAFQAWIGRTANVREMHQKMAVGKGIGVQFDDKNKQIIVRSRVSKGARDTWTKVQEGVLTGYSVGAINPVWGTVERDGKTYPYLTSYDLTELSLVDNPSNPDSYGLAIFRADGLTEVIETSEPEPPVQPPPPTETRAGARISTATKGQMHEAQKHLLYGAMANAKNCGCDDCQNFIKTLDPDNDGDIDLGGYDDTDGDADDMQNRSAQASPLDITDLSERIEKALTTALAPLYSRQNQFLARLAQIDTPTSPDYGAQLESLQAEVTRLAEQVKPVSFPDEVRAELSAVKGLVERIAAQPMPGGPTMPGAPRPVDKRLPTDAPATQMVSPSMVEGVLDLLKERGMLDTLDKQTAAASLLVQPVRGRIPGGNR